MVYRLTITLFYSARLQGLPSYFIATGSVLLSFIAGLKLGVLFLVVTLHFFFFFLANVLTFVGLPPTPCFTARLRLTALFFWDAVILEAFEAGTHFGYPLFDFFADFLPQGG